MRKLCLGKGEGAEKPAGTWSHSFKCILISHKPVPACQGAEVQVKNFAPETQSGAIAYLHVIKPQGIPYWNIPSKTRNETSLYKCVHVCVCVYIYSARVPVQLMHLNCPKCLSQRLFFSVPSLFSPFCLSRSFIFYLLPVVFWLSLNGSQSEKRLLGTWRVIFDAAYVSVCDLLPLLKQAKGPVLSAPPQSQLWHHHLSGCLSPSWDLAQKLVAKLRKEHRLYIVVLMAAVFDLSVFVCVCVCVYTYSKLASSH